MASAKPDTAIDTGLCDAVHGSVTATPALPGRAVGIRAEQQDGAGSRHLTAAASAAVPGVPVGARARLPTELHACPGAFHAYDMVPDARLTRTYFRDFIGALGRHFDG